jgi:hypothetical protein
VRVNNWPMVIAFLIAQALCLLVTPGVAQLTGRPNRVVLAVMSTIGAVGSLAVGNARWATFGRAFQVAPVTLWLLVGGVLVLSAATLVALIVKPGPTLHAALFRCASLIPIIALSLPPRHGAPMWAGDEFVGHLTSALTAGNFTFTATVIYDILPNVAVYVPAAFAWSGVMGSLTRAVAVFASASCSIELYQAAFTDRVCQITDLLGNVCGAALGAALFFTLRVRPEPTSDPVAHYI